MDLETINILDTFLSFNKTVVMAGGGPLGLIEFKKRNAGEFILNTMDQNSLYFTSSHKKSEKKSAINQIVDLLDTTVEKLNEMNLFDFLMECSEKEVRIDHRKQVVENEKINNPFSVTTTGLGIPDFLPADAKKYIIPSKGRQILKQDDFPKQSVDDDTAEFIKELSKIEDFPMDADLNS